MARARKTINEADIHPGGVRAARVFLQFLSTATEADGSPITNYGFGRSVGLNDVAAKSQVTQWLRGSPIPPARLVNAMEAYPDFPLLKYLEAASDIKSDNAHHLQLAIMAIREYERYRYDSADDFHFNPPESLLKGNLASLANPAHDFEQELLADQANDQATTREERQVQVTRYQDAIKKRGT